MPTFRVFKTQEEIVTRKWMYDVEAPDVNSAALLAASGEVDPVDCGTVGEPLYGESEFAVLPPDVAGVIGWDEVVANLESIKGDGQLASMPNANAEARSSVVEAIEVALNYFEDTRHGKEWIEAGGVEADMLRSALKLLHAD